MGHQYGPDSEELKQAIRDVDEVLYDFLDRMTDTGLDESVWIDILFYIDKLMFHFCPNID